MKRSYRGISIWVGIFILIFGSPMLINLLVSFRTQWTVEEGSDWISFFGNYSGGLIGGVVAYLITRYQFTMQKRNDAEKELRSQLPVLYKLKSVLRILGMQFSYMANIDETLNKSLNPYPKIKVSLKDIDKDLWKDIWILKNTWLQEKFLQHVEFYEDARSILSADIVQMEIKLEQLKRSLSTKILTARTDEDKIEIMELKEQIAILELECKEQEWERKDVWQTFLMNNYTIGNKTLLELVNKEITEIEGRDKNET
ncbi:hypothetical protein [Brevibacillus fortis]|uniref:hypothetical protein n=1 Tax=Brevibacillus fortis TaxID=2126352 RepID=UPI0038FC8F93